MRSGNSFERPVLKKLLAELWFHVGQKRRVQLCWLIALMVFASLAEVVSLGALVPFLGVIASPEDLFFERKAQYLIKLFDISSPFELLFPITIFFCAAVLVSGLARLLLLWTTTKLSYGLGADLSFSIYRRTLYQPYVVHITRNSSELVAGISTKISSVILHVINPLLILISSLIILLSILALLVLIDPSVALASFFGFGIIYLMIIKFSKSRLLENANRISFDTNRVIKSIQESLGSIRDVLIGGAQEIYCDIYQKDDLALRKAQGSNYFIGNSPRFIVEAFGMVLIAIIALNLAQHDGNSSKTIITLGIFALGAQRLLPILQQIFYSLTTIKGNEGTLRDVVGLLNQKLPPSVNSGLMQRMGFKNQIDLQSISFSYGEAGPLVLKDINLTIKKGCRIGFIGATGSGKSTLVDLVMALLMPTSGILKVDGVEITQDNYDLWQKNIAHVPQSIYLMDSSIAENIAFGEQGNEIDMLRVQEAARKAQIADTIESWASGYNTMVGEDGVNLSGGQRQRIAIARALYKKVNLIVFDEATSALDEATEESLMRAIDGLNPDLTVLIIAHRLSTLKGCDQIIELKEGMVQRIGSYYEVIQGAP